MAPLPVVLLNGHSAVADRNELATAAAPAEIPHAIQMRRSPAGDRTPGIAAGAAKDLPIFTDGHVTPRSPKAMPRSHSVVPEVSLGPVHAVGAAVNRAVVAHRNRHVAPRR